MRILHLIHSEGVYGAELILLYLAREQQQHGHEPLVGSIRDPRTEQTPFEALAQSWGLPVVGIRIASRPTPPVVRSLLRTVREVAPDVLHSHGYKANILLGPLPRRLRGPMIATLHGWTAARTFSALWLYERLDRLSLRRIDSVVVVARCMLQLAALRGVAPAPRRVIENGIPPRGGRRDSGAPRRGAARPARRSRRSGRAHVRTAEPDVGGLQRGRSNRLGLAGGVGTLHERSHGRGIPRGLRGDTGRLNRSASWAAVVGVT